MKRQACNALDIHPINTYNSTMLDEGPSQEDLERFGEIGTAYCPYCSEEISELADVCPHCKSWLTRGPSRERPFNEWWRQRTITGIIIILLIAMFITFVLIF